MNPNFLNIINAPVSDRRDLFLSAANRVGTTIQNIEKDFWVCWVLDLLFNNKSTGEPRLLFKGGTSLSKAYGLISRFSEDVDITVFREDLGQNIEPADLENLSGKQQRQKLDQIKKSCQIYIQGSLINRLNKIMAEYQLAPVLLDPSDPDQQTLLVQYPSVTYIQNSYIQPSVKIEAGAKSALDPHQSVNISPYISEDLPENNLIIQNIITINPERTFWDKVVILHGLRRWHDHRGGLRHEGNRVSRHYYDLYQLLNSNIGQQARKDKSLAINCAHHAELFFNSKDFDLKDARPGSFTLSPSLEMISFLKKDYLAMSTMIFGEVPDFEAVIQKIRVFELEINQ